MLLKERGRLFSSAIFSDLRLTLILQKTSNGDAIDILIKS